MGEWDHSIVKTDQKYLIYKNVKNLMNNQTQKAHIFLPSAIS